jgi:hypothetical protein
LLKDVNLADLLRSEAVSEVRQRAQHTAPALHARTVEELALIFQDVGDLTTLEIADRCAVDPAGWVGQLAGSQRIVSMSIPTAHGLETRVGRGRVCRRICSRLRNATKFNFAVRRRSAPARSICTPIR